jgi:hypothetical protein
MAVDFKKLGRKAKATTKSKASAKPASKSSGEKQYDESNRFVLFANDKEGNENRPDYTGKITLEDGHVLRLAGWLKESDKVGQYISGLASEPQAE